MSLQSKKLTEGSLLAKNTLYSLIGYIIPVIVALFAIPILINSLGVDKFGVLTLAWMITGYFSILDLGIGRALTKLLSEKLGNDDMKNIPSLISTSLIVTTACGLFGCAVLTLYSSNLVTSLFKIPAELHDDVIRSFYVLALSIPFVINVAALRGILEAYQRFDLINILRIPIASSTFLVPVLISQLSEELFHIVIGLVIVRVVEIFVNLIFCKKVISNMYKNQIFNSSIFKELINFGGWMTISNLIGPMILYIDRFLIGSIISVGAVSFYSASYEIVNRMMVIPGAVVGVLFPAIGVLIGNDKDRAIEIFYQGMKYTLLIIFPIVLIIFIFSEEGLSLWLGDEFASKGTNVLRILIVGSLIMSVSYFPFAVMHAAGKPKVIAIIHIIEVPTYAIITVMLIRSYGIEGAAFAWLIRLVVDTVVLFYFAGKELNINYHFKRILLTAGLLLLIFLISFFISNNFILKLSFGFTILAFFLLYAYNKMLNFKEKEYLLSLKNKFF